jgi:hypothetical protein
LTGYMRVKYEFVGHAPDFARPRRICGLRA